MSDEYGASFITVTDDEGNEFTLEHLDTLELNGNTYLAFFPAETEDGAPEEEELGLILMKAVTVDGEELLSTLDSDEEAAEVYDAFMLDLFEEAEEEE